MNFWLILTIIVSCFVVYSILVSIYRYFVIMTHQKGWSTGGIVRAANIRLKMMFG